MARKEILVDPDWLVNGQLAAQMGVTDDLLAEDPIGARCFAAIVDYLVHQLDPDVRESVELVVWGRMPYREAAAYQGCDPKTVWRRVQKATEQIMHEFEQPIRVLFGIPEPQEESECD